MDMSACDIKILNSRSRCIHAHANVFLRMAYDSVMYSSYNF